MKKLFIYVFIALILLAGAYVTAVLIDNFTPDTPEQQYEKITQVDANKNDFKDDNNKIISTAPVVVNSVENLPLSFDKPVNGEIGMAFSTDKLIYSKTLEEWTTHSGIDILAKRGTPVSASEKGIIENITETANKGIEITIRHRDNYKTVYSNLSTKNMVEIGQEVEKGQIISGVGNTAAFEYYEPDHLHFEVYNGNVPVDPNILLP